MCEICDGKTLDEVLEGMHDRIGEHGFTMQGVEGTPDKPPWVYTVGLTDRFDHPELYLRGYPVTQSAALLNDLAQIVMRGHELAAGESVGFSNETHIHLDEVDPERWDDGTFNQWWNYYGWLGDGFGQPDALEVRLCGPPPWFADAAGAADAVGAHRPNRAARRAAARRRDRHLRALR